MPLWKNHVMSLWVKWVLSLVWQKALQLDLSYLTVFISVLLCTLLSHCTVSFWACPDPSDSHQNHSFCYDKLSFNHHDKKPTKAICTMEQGVCTKTPRLTWTSLCNYFLPILLFPPHVVLPLYCCAISVTQDKTPWAQNIPLYVPSIFLLTPQYKQ